MGDRMTYERAAEQNPTRPVCMVFGGEIRPLVVFGAEVQS